ncbi:MAG: hypothetical protein H6636_00205 [Anaerolineales bacterium]|nr:hypothetical protein [Anaerolineales bacterium]
MKKITLLFISLLFFLFFVLSACSSGTDTTSTETTGTNNPTPAGDTPTNMQLALGTFALEETDYAITAEQAAELLPLWKAAKALADNETLTAEEYQAIYTQIEDTLTAEQMNAIKTIDMSSDAMTALREKYGLSVGGGNFDPANLSPEQQATREAFQQSRQNGGTTGGSGFSGGVPPDGGVTGGGPGGGGFPGGGPGGGLGGDGTGFSPEAQQTAIASGAGGGRQFGGNGALPSTFYDAIITFLEGKIQ